MTTLEFHQVLWSKKTRVDRLLHGVLCYCRTASTDHDLHRNFCANRYLFAVHYFFYYSSMQLTKVALTTETKQTQNKTKLFCFGFDSVLRTCETKCWNKMKVYLSIKVLTSDSNYHCCLVNIMSYALMRLLTAMHHVYESHLFIRL